MPINASYEYLNAEKKYLAAQTLEEKIAALKEMISTAPSHKGAENLRAELKARLKKLLEKKEKSKKSKGSSQKAIKKEGYQIVIIGFSNSGKSSLLTALTNAKPEISPLPFTTKKPEIGTLDYEGIKAQVIDLPSIGSENFDIGIVNSADSILIVLSSLEELSNVEQILVKAKGKRIIVINKCDLLSQEELRKLQERIKSKKLNILPISAISGLNLEELRTRIIQNMEVIRVFMKEPGKSPSPIPMVMPLNSTVKDVAEKILKGFSSKIKETRVTGPSSKFPNQKVGLSHILKDKDIVEFHTY